MRIFQAILVLFFFIQSSFSSDWNCTMIETKGSPISNDSISEQCTISVAFTNTKHEKHICIARTLAIESLPPLSLDSNHTMQTFRIHSCQLSAIGQLPFSLPSSVQLLDLRNNSLSTFILSFPLPSNLQYLYLDRNPNLTELDFGSNRVQHKLIGLSLRHNQKMQISSLPPHLIELDLSDCHLFQSPILSLLKSLTNLTHLSLADNLLEQLPSIDESLRLEYLNLSNNHLTSIDDRWLHGSLQTLDLRSNRIQSLEFLNERFSGTSNQVIINHHLQLFLSGNPLTCDCWLGGLLNTSSLIIDDFHLLQCHSGSIMPISYQNFMCSYSRHCASDCSCCDFEACDCHAVCPSDCSCAHDIHWSRHTVQCSQANLSNIHLLLPQTMTELNYQGNHIELIEPFVFVGKISLQKLNLAKNNLKDFTNETFCPATDLREINLSENPQLSNIGSRLNQFFGCLKHLQLITLSKNQMMGDRDISDGWMIHSSSNDTLLRLRRVEGKLSTIPMTSTIPTVFPTSSYRPTRLFSILSRTASSFPPQQPIKFTAPTVSTFIRNVSFIHHNQTLIIIVFFLLLFVVLFLILLIILAICRRKLRRHLTAELQRQRSHHYYYHTRLHPPSVKMLENHALPGANDSLYEQLPSLSSDSEQPFLYNEKKPHHPNAPVLPPHPAAFRHHLCCHAGSHLLRPSPTNIHEYQYATNLTTTTGCSTPTSQQHQCAAVLVWANRLLYSTQNAYNHSHDCSTHSCSSEMQHLQQRLLSNQADQTSATTDQNNVVHCCNNETIFLPTTAAATSCRCGTHGPNTDTYIYPHVHR